MDAAVQEIYNTLGSNDERTLRHFATVINGLVLTDPGNKGAIINWAKGVYQGRHPNVPTIADPHSALPSIVNFMNDNAQTWPRMSC